MTYDQSHFGDPCIHCDTPHDDVAPGPCTGVSLTRTHRELAELLSSLKAHEEASAKESARLKGEIAKRRAVVNQVEAGLDAEKIALARTVLRVTDYSRGGSEKASARADAIRQLATGEPIRQFYGDLWHVAFGTKNYDRWDGQRCDVEYGYGPCHGSICFSIGLLPEVRQREPKALTPAETEAAIYYLTHLERIQAAEKAAMGADQ